MRVVINHRKTKAEAMKAVERAVQDALRALATGPLTITDTQKTWKGSVMTFSVTVKMGLLKNVISGTAAVTENDITIDLDLGFLGQFIAEKKIRTSVESSVRGLLG